MAKNTAPSRVFVVDDHPVCRIGIQSLLEREPDLVICGEAEDAAMALTMLRQVPANLAIIDFMLKGSSGLDLVKQLKIEFPSLRTLLMSMHDEAIFTERALRAGATGYVRKDATASKIVEAVRQALGGQLVVSADVATSLLRRLTGTRPAGPVNQQQAAKPVPELSASQLTDREVEILQLLGQGLSTRHCAQKLHLSVKTVEAHQANLKNKLGLSDLNQLRRYAAIWISKTT
jgi:DNA-binding NarL/FixJ family response regulator